MQRLIILRPLLFIPAFSVAGRQLVRGVVRGVAWSFYPWSPGTYNAFDMNYFTNHSGHIRGVCTPGVTPLGDSYIAIIAWPYSWPTSGSGRCIAAIAEDTGETFSCPCPYIFKTQGKRVELTPESRR